MGRAVSTPTTTSIAAAKSVDVTVLEQMVLDAIEAAGSAGCISDEVQVAYPSLSYSSVTARFKALEDKCLIVRGPDERKGASGRGQMVMRAAAHAASAPPAPPPKKRERPAFMKGVMFAARIILKASDLADAKRMLKTELAVLAKKYT